MSEKILGKFLHRKRQRSFGAWQLELTTRCPLRCKMCIRSECDHWQSQDMEFANFQKIVPYLKDVETVVLEGWGESLLHRDLIRCIRLAKEQGASVGFVTSGMGLTKDRVEELVDAGQDFIGFSISGTTPATHDAIRVNSHLPDLLHTVQLFQEEKKRRNVLHPKIHFIFLMVKENLHEIPMAPSFTKQAGVEELFLTNICHTINTWQEEQRIFVWDKGDNPYEAAVHQAEVNAHKLQIRLKRPALRATEVAVCEENPLRNLYISADGEVSPCVYLYPPLPSPFKRIFCSGEYETQKVSFGNIFRDPFPKIWDCDHYREFRNHFLARERAYQESYFSLFNGPRLANPQGVVLSEPPEACKTCHKIIGI